MTKKTKREQSKRFSYSYLSFFSARLSSIIAIILLLASIGILYAKNQELERRHDREERPPILQSTPTPEPAVKGEQSVPTSASDSDPIVNCAIHANCGGGSKQMRLSECNQMTCCTIHEKCGGGARFITKTECNNLYCCFLRDGTSKLMTKSECDNYYSASSNIVGGNNTSSSSTYPPCTIYYPNLNHTETYYHLSPEQCQKSKESLIIPTYQPLPTIEPYIPLTSPTPTPTTTYTPPNSQLRAECQAKVRDKYRSEAIRYGCFFDPNESCEEYDPTSACCAVKAFYKKEMEKCSQLYP